MPRSTSFRIFVGVLGDLLLFAATLVPLALTIAVATGYLP